MATKTKDDGWDHATRDLADGTTIRHGDAVLVEATYTQSNVNWEAGRKIGDPHGPEDELWLNVQGHAPVFAPLEAVHALPAPGTYIVIGVHEYGHENRYAESFEAESPEEAEGLALDEHPALLIAAVVEGPCRVVDDGGLID